MMSYLKWRSTDRLFENIHFLSDYSISSFVYAFLFHNYIPRRKSGIYWIQVRRAAAAAAVEISLWMR